MKQLRRSSTSSLSPTVNSSSSKKKESGSASWVLGRVRRIKRCSSNVLIPLVDNTSLLPPLQSQTILRTSKSANFLVSPVITQTTNNGSDSNTTDWGGDDAYSSSSCSSFSLLATPKAVLQLEKFDDDLDLIGCHHQNHSSSSSSSSQSTNRTAFIERVDRNNYSKVCFIGRGCYADVCMVTNSNTKENFALKSLNPKRIKDPETLLKAATDFAMEAKHLSELDHKNIIKLKGICSTSFSQSFTDDTEEGYFLILDLLEEVLSDRLERWRKDARKASYETKWSLAKPKLNIKKMYGRMENVALGIVKGMIYLHEKGIVMRDLKPQNIGFDEGGTVRLFDFGMARKLEDCDNDDICGSPRYMDPSLMTGKGYSLKSDVYSFGIILYELCSLTIAYGKNKNHQDKKEFNRRLVEDNMSPKLTRISCPITRKLIEDCWQTYPNKRPSFEEIYQRIKEVVKIDRRQQQPDLRRGSM